MLHRMLRDLLQSDWQCEHSERGTLRHLTGPSSQQNCLIVISRCSICSRKQVLHMQQEVLMYVYG